MSQKASCDSIFNDPVTNVFSPKEVRSHFQICDHSIITLGKIGFCLGFSNTYNVDSLYRLRRSVVDKFKLYIGNLMKKKHYMKRK